MGKKYELSLMDSKAEEAIKSIEGLCTKRFHADIITKDLDYERLKSGDVILLQGKKILIQKVGKECFAECPLPKDEKPCILSCSVAFGKYMEN